MEKENKSSQYIFWLNPWKNFPLPIKIIDRDRVVRCIINNQEIIIEDGIAAGKQPIYISLQAIREIGIEALNDVTFLISIVRIITKENKSVTLVPTNPFEPNLSFQSNGSEVRAMINVIQALKDGRIPDYDTNPYTREYANRNKDKSLIYSEVDWNENVSPQIYFHQYQAGLDRKRKITELVFKIFTLLFVMICTIYLLWYIFR